MARFVLEKQGEIISTLTMDVGMISIGSALHNLVRLPKGEVRDYHAHIVICNGQAYLDDLDSDLPWRGETAARRIHTLTEGKQYPIGSYSIRVESLGQPDETGHMPLQAIK